jgi:hypothetical protein
MIVVDLASVLVLHMWFLRDFGVQQLLPALLLSMQSKAKFLEREFRQNFFFGPLSPSLRFRAQLFADFVTFNNINVRSDSLSSYH